MVNEINQILSELESINSENYAEKANKIRDYVVDIILNDESLVQMSHHLDMVPSLKKKFLCLNCPVMEECSYRGKNVILCGDKEIEED